jgi:hypothetical protein
VFDCWHQQSGTSEDNPSNLAPQMSRIEELWDFRLKSRMRYESSGLYAPDSLSDLSSSIFFYSFSIH